jgi:hypothetical protein
VPLAPDLRFARDRIAPDTLVRWIENPAGVWPKATMPALGLSAGDAELVADFVRCAPIELGGPSLRFDAPPAADHFVSWAEVKEKVLGHVCVHCHMNDHEKDTGPGNHGGLGYAGKGLAMRTYEMLVHGASESDQRYSVLVPREGEARPRLLQVLLDRRVENDARDRQTAGDLHAALPYPGGLLGMPLGLPAVSDEDYGLVAKWIDEGCPGPTEVTGMPGTTDGFLVPDGPIAKNTGCELRDPVEPPPPWATRPAHAQNP